MPKSRSVSRSASVGTIAIDASYAQELIEFLAKKYEQVKEELGQVKETSVAASSSPQESSYDEDDEERASGPSSVTECEEESELDTLRTHNEDLKNQLAASEKERLELWQQIEGFLAQNTALAAEADLLREQTINSTCPSAAFLPTGAITPTLRFTSPQALSEELSDNPEVIRGGHSICFLPRPPACLPLRVTACGRHGYWFSPVVTYPKDVEFELVVEGRPSEWTYLGRYRSVYLPGGEMRLSEWSALDDETKGMHCIRVAAQTLGQHATTPAAVSSAAAELMKQYESGKAAASCFILVCTGFSPQLNIALQGAATRTRKRKSVWEDGGRRVKREVD